MNTIIWLKKTIRNLANSSRFWLYVLLGFCSFILFICFCIFIFIITG